MNENEKQKLRWEGKMEARRLGLTPVTTYSVHGNVIDVRPVKGGEVSEAPPKAEPKAEPKSKPAADSKGDAGKG